MCLSGISKKNLANGSSRTTFLNFDDQYPQEVLLMYIAEALVLYDARALWLPSMEFCRTYLVLP